MIKTEKQQVLCGELYRASDLEIQLGLEKTRQWLVHYNASRLAFGRPVRLGRNDWIDIGDDAVIVAGSVFTRDVDAGKTVLTL